MNGLPNGLTAATGIGVKADPAGADLRWAYKKLLRN